MLPTRHWPALLGLLPLVAPSPAGAVLHQRDLVNDWVSLGPDASPHTRTAAVTTDAGGAVRTTSGAPYMLTGSVFAVSKWTEISTTTGPPPPPEASATDGAGGQFAVCHNRAGMDGPFCEPAAGSMLSVGRTYFVTWDSTYFGLDARDDLVNITATYLPSNRRVLSAFPVPASQGYMALTIRESWLLGQENFKRVRLVMTYVDDEGEAREIPGPRVNIMRTDVSVAAVAGEESREGAGGGRGVHPAAVAVPVVVGLFAVGLGIWCLWRRNKDRLVLSGIRRRSGQGYGVGRSRTARAAAEGKEGIDLQESPASPPPPRAGGNVFREEIQRQDAGQ